jgi:lipoprotein-anchoring transpeptidase ErfK/SrfK
MIRRQFLTLLAAGMTTAATFFYKAFAIENATRDITKDIQKLENKFGLKPDEYAIIVNPERQELYLVRDRKIIKIYPISTSKNGMGTVDGSNKTPWGTHRIKEKIGGKNPIGTFFVVRKPIGLAKISTKKCEKVRPGAITTRIMWLDGQEEGINKGGHVDSHTRYIYIHGTASEGRIGQPDSIGCVEMKNEDVIELFNTVPSGTLVEIQNKEYSEPVAVQKRCHDDK